MVVAGKKGWNVLFFNVAVCQNLVPLVNIKIAGKWMFIPLKMVLIGIDPYPCIWHQPHNLRGDRLRIGDQQFFLSAVWLGGALKGISATSFPTFLHSTSRSKMMDNLETYKKIIWTVHIPFAQHIHQYSSIFLSRKMVGYDGVRSTHLGNQGLLRAPQTIGPVVLERTQLGWGYIHIYIYIIYWMGFWQLTWLDRSIGHLELFGVIYIYYCIYKYI